MKKNFFAALLLLLSVFSFNHSTATAQDTLRGPRVLIGDLYYNLDTADHTAAVTWDRYLDTLNYHGLHSAVIPASVLYEEVEYQVSVVDSSAFARCNSLETLVLPNSVRMVGASAFASCTSLSEVTCYAAVPPEVGDRPFYNIDPNATLYVPAELVSKYGYADVWKDFPTISPIPTPGIVRTKIGDLYYNIDSARHTAAVTWDRYDRLSNYRGTKTVIIPETVTYEDVSYPVTAVDTLAFITCDSLETLVLPNSLTEIRYSAFMMCYELKNITYGSGLKTIGAAAFSGCTGLSEIIIPDQVEYVGGSAFMSCRKATRVVIGSGVKHLGDRAFQGCDTLPAFEVAEGNTILCTVDGVLMNMAKDTLIQFPAGRGGEYVVPASVTAIGDGSFYDCRHLTAITFPEGLTYLGTVSFNACKGLTEIVLPNGVTAIPSAFTACSGLKSVTIGNAVAEIGMTAFAQCTALETFTCHTVTPPALGMVPFLMVKLDSCTLYVPAESVEAYRAAATWQDFGTIEPLPVEALDEVGANALTNTRKFMVNGRLLILRDGKTYTVTGSEVR